VFHVKGTLYNLEKTIDKLNLEADNSLSKVQEKNSGVPLPLTDCATDVIIDKISLKVPHVVKGSKNKRGIISLEKNKGKKKKVLLKKVQTYWGLVP
jgi:hypothetical protein